MRHNPGQNLHGTVLAAALQKSAEPFSAYLDCDGVGGRGKGPRRETGPHFDRRRRWELCGTTGSAQQNCAAGSADGPGRYFEEARAVAAAAVSACCTGFVISCKA